MTIWTDEFVERVKAEYLSGVGPSEIGRRYGLTRSTITTKLQRLGISRSAATARVARKIAEARAKPAPTPKPAVAKAEPRAQAKVFGETRVKPVLIIAGCGAVIEKPPGQAPKASVKAHAWKPLEGAEPVPLTERPPGACAWPVDVPGTAEPHSCAIRCADGETYCLVHRAMAHPGPEPGKRNKTANELARSLRRYVA